MRTKFPQFIDSSIFYDRGKYHSATSSKMELKIFTKMLLLGDHLH